jgi:quercetin dioxygenase-like cupin family protein
MNIVERKIMNPETHGVKLEEGFSDNRGLILPIIHDFANVQMIYSLKGAIRANHYHKTDSHYCYMVSGSVRYLWRNHGEDTIHEEYFGPGQMFLTGPNIDHEMIFQEDSTMVVVSEHKRDASTYDEDIVRIDPLHEQF